MATDPSPHIHCIAFGRGCGPATERLLDAGSRLHAAALAVVASERDDPASPRRRSGNVEALANAADNYSYSRDRYDATTDATFAVE